MLRYTRKKLSIQNFPKNIIFRTISMLDKHKRLVEGYSKFSKFTKHDSQFFSILISPILRTIYVFSPMISYTLKDAHNKWPHLSRDIRFVGIIGNGDSMKNFTSLHSNHDLFLYFRRYLPTIRGVPKIALSQSFLGQLAKFLIADVNFIRQYFVIFYRAA